MELGETHDRVIPHQAAMMKRLAPFAVLVIAAITVWLGWRFYAEPVIDITAVNPQQQVAQVVWYRDFPTGMSAELQIKTGVADTAKVLCQIPLLTRSEEGEIYREYRSIEWLDASTVSLEAARNSNVGQILVDLDVTRDCAE